MLNEGNPARPQNVLSLSCHLGWILSLLFLGLGAKCLLITNFSDPLAYNDQWVGEAADVYVPYFEQSLSFANFFRLNNEHRIVFTRIYDLALVWLNGEWDSQVQMLLNAAIHCLALAGFGCLLVRFLGFGFWPVVWLPLALSLTLPFNWENTVWGFQSQFYFLLTFSILTIWLLGVSPTWSKRWWVGFFAAFCALFTIASGLLVSVAVASLELLKISKQPKNWRKHLPTLGACLVVVIVGLLLIGHVPRHETLKAHTPGAFFNSLAASLAWPSIFNSWLFPLNVLPLALLGWAYFRSRGKALRGEEMVLGIAFWIFWQGVAIAYARGAQGNFPAWRYMDIACLIMTADCVAIALLVKRFPVQERFRLFWYCIFFAWALCSSASLLYINYYALSDPLPWWKRTQAARAASTRAFLATDNESAFVTGDVFTIPYADVSKLVSVLRAPCIRTNLPASVRDPLKVALAKVDGDAFIPNGCPLAPPPFPADACWGSWSAAPAPKARGSSKSLPIEASALPYLEIQVAGGLGAPGLSLTLIDSVTGDAKVIEPQAPPGNQWLPVHIKAPAHAFYIVARDDSDSSWFAFQAPRELGRLSYWTARTLAAWPQFFMLGAACFVWSASNYLWARRVTVKKTAGAPAFL
jgi:hypothetical protein